MGIPYLWEVTVEETEKPYPCDQFIHPTYEAYWRGIDVRAPAEILFRWLCQLKVAPYSYDWIDNGGRPSPRELSPGLDSLEIGQRVMSIFRLADFERPVHLTLVLDKPSAKKLFGEIAVTYQVIPQSPILSRLVAKLCVSYSGGARGAVQRAILPWGDFIMMRKQFLTLKRLAEAED